MVTKLDYRSFLELNSGKTRGTLVVIVKECQTHGNGIRTNLQI